MNHPRTDWAFTVARRYLYEHADALRLEALMRSSYAPVAELAAKMRREETYHLLHFDIWLKRLAEAGGEARERLAARAATACGPMRRPSSRHSPAKPTLVEAGILPEPLAALRATWLERVTAALDALGLPTPDASALPAAGRAHAADR